MNFRSLSVFITINIAIAIFYWVSVSQPTISKLGEFQPVNNLKISQTPFYNSDGKSFQLSDFKGKLIIVHSFASWCAPCMEEIPEMINFYKNFKEKGVVLLCIQREPLRDKIDFQDLPIYFDQNNKLVQEMNLISGVPSSLFISPSEKDKLIILGKAPWNSDKMNQKIQELLTK